MSRDLDTAIVVDGTTRSRCARAGFAFEERGPTTIRGRSDPVEVSTLSP